MRVINRRNTEGYRVAVFCIWLLCILFCAMQILAFTGDSLIISKNIQDCRRVVKKLKNNGSQMAREYKQTATPHARREHEPGEAPQDHQSTARKPHKEAVGSEGTAQGLPVGTLVPTLSPRWLPPRWLQAQSSRGCSRSHCRPWA